MNGCLTTDITRKGGDLLATLNANGGLATSMGRAGGTLSFSMVKRPAGTLSSSFTRNGGVSFSMGLVCSTGVSGYEVLLASDGTIYSVNGVVFFVRKES